MAAVVAVLAVILVANVLLTVAVIRRLAAHERKLASFSAMFAAPGGLAPGEPVPAFAAQTTAGERIDESHLFPGPAAIAFFSATCEACATHAPEFAALAGSGTPTLAVLSGEGGSAERILAALGPVDVVHEPGPGGPLTRHFRVDTFPTYFALEAGHVMAPVGSAGELGVMLGH